MTDTRAVVLATTLAVIAAVGMTAPFVTAAGVGTLGGGPADSSATVAGTATNDSNNTSMGAELSGFMQASSASANGSVDNGMFGAAYNDSNGSDRTALVERRTETLERRIAVLEAQKERLIENKGNMSEVAYNARMSAIVSRIEALYDAIDQTATFANETGANMTKVQQLRDTAANLTGPEVARIARNISGVDDPGKPEAVGNNESGAPNGTPGAGSGDGNGDGKPDDPGKDDGSPNEAPGKDDDDSSSGNGNGGQGNGGK